MTELKTYTNTYNKYGKELTQCAMLPSGLKIMKVSISPDYVDEDKPDEPILYELYMRFEGASRSDGMLRGNGSFIETFGQNFTLNTYNEALSLAEQIIKDMNGE